ncbi:uncharacterized protein [Physeter macrocephalus]|uniref:Uncharacterized protein n=1 Tax=Physeter macrocephalus TaxID=9755 RepID=A0A455BZQ8_PHYMC|nr:uncharacterized protein LOC114486800 [Physeter catodon]|eukprot:XP_028349236.1 uncharacterized protein LOC114486800 [Physeter catodon]
MQSNGRGFDSSLPLKSLPTCFDHVTDRQKPKQVECCRKYEMSLKPPQGRQYPEPSRPPPSGLVPASQGLEKEGVPSPGRASCEQVQCSAGTGKGELGPRKVDSEEPPVGGRDPARPPRARAPPAGAWSPGEEEQAGARCSPRRRTVTEFDTRKGSWSLARTPDPSQMETLSPSEPAGILCGISPRPCLLAHLTEAAFITLRRGRFQMERGSRLQNKETTQEQKI